MLYDAPRMTLPGSEPFSLFCLDLVERPLASMKLGRDRLFRLIVRAVLPILVVWLPLDEDR